MQNVLAESSIPIPNSVRFTTPTWPPGGSVGTGTELMAVLDGIPQPAILIDRRYRILAANDAYRAAYANGAALCGRRCHEVSHRCSRPCDVVGENCPLAACAQTREPSRAVHVHHTPRGEELHDVTFYPVCEEAGELQAFLEIVRPCEMARARPDRHNLVGRSPVFNKMIELVQRVAPTDTAALLIGESGTGKELVAHATHKKSRRASAPFVPVDCSGLSESLFESELFGHERGAFTGAVNRKRGLVDAARGGTLFLDEVGDIPLHLQVKLLRLIETRTFRRVGNAEPVSADFRLICATHGDLPTMVADGKFRSDLYFRISPYPIRLPPLRERIEDLPLLVESLLRRIAPGRELRLAAESLAILEDHSFPGNVRELLNILERASLLVDGTAIEPRHLSEACRRGYGSPYGLPPGPDIRSLEEIENRYLRWAYAHSDSDNATLARRLGLGERTFYRKMRRARAQRC